MALLAALLAVSTMPPPDDAFEDARLGVLRLVELPELPELVRRFALDPLEPARDLVVRFALLFDLRFAVLLEVRFAPLLDARDVPLDERVLLVPLRAAAGFPFADFVPPELLLPRDFVVPLVRCVALPDLASAISRPPSSESAMAAGLPNRRWIDAKSAG